MGKRVFIQAGAEYNGRFHHVPAPIFRKKFDWAEGSSARLEITAVGFYRAFLNGTELKKGWFAPYISNPEQFVYYDEFEVGNLLKEKDNLLCVMLGNGFSNAIDFNIWDFEKAEFRSAPKLYLGLYAGEKRVVTTDESFEVCDWAILFDDLRAGERFNARLADDFLAFDYTGRNARKAIIAKEPKGEYRKFTTQPILEYESIAPVGIKKTKKGYLYDFGVNHAGVYTLKIDGKEGQRIDLRFGEVVADGELDCDNISFQERTDLEYIQHDVYICKEGAQEYTPSFTYHGFQYVAVEGITQEQATKELLTFRVLHSAIPQIGKFVCSDEVINKIQECAVRSDLSNFYYFPTDCPHREKNGWSDDAGISAEQFNYNFDTYPSFETWFENIRASQKADGQLPGIIPTTGWGYEWGNGPLSDIFIFEIPYQFYRFTGKKELIEQNADMMLRYVDFMLAHIREDGLVAYGLMDWCEAGSDKNHDYSTPLEVTDTLLCVCILRLAEKLMKIIGKDAPFAEWKRAENSLISAFEAHYMQEKGWVSCKSQTAQAMAIALGLFGEDEALAYQNLLEVIKRCNNRIRIGVTGSKFLFDVLASHGGTELAYQLIADPAWPSYGYLISLGATTLWEQFQHFEKVDGELKLISEPPVISRNHHFWGSISAWFYRVLAGLNVIDCNTVNIQPQPVSQLTFAEAEWGRDGKRIYTRWERVGEKIALTVENHGYQGAVSVVGYRCDGEKELPLEEGKKEYIFE